MCWSLGTISLLYIVEAAISGLLVARGIIFVFTRYLDWPLSFLVPNYFKNSSLQTIKLYILIRGIIIAFIILVLETSTIPIFNTGLVMGYGLGFYLIYWIHYLIAIDDLKINPWWGLIAWNAAGVTGAIIGMIATGDYRMCLACVPLKSSSFGLGFGILVWPLGAMEYSLISILEREVGNIFIFFFMVMADIIIVAVVDGVIAGFNVAMGV